MVCAAPGPTCARAALLTLRARARATTLLLISPIAESLTIVHLPDGPTSHYKLTSIRTTDQISVRQLPCGLAVTPMRRECGAVHICAHTVPTRAHRAS